MTEHETYMGLALEAAREAERHGEIPIGCIIVHQGQVVARAHNRRELDQDPLAHAEVLALRAAAEVLGSWRLENTALYVTLEPCAMCSGAIILSRVAEVYFGAYDPKAGCCGSLMNLLEDTRFNHRPKLTGGVMGEECGGLLTGFFQGVRARQRAAREAGKEHPPVCGGSPATNHPLRRGTYDDGLRRSPFEGERRDSP